MSLLLDMVFEDAKYGSRISLLKDVEKYMLS
jgi:hypothetical protein